MTELHFSFVARPFSTKLTEAVYYDIVYFHPTWINGVFFYPIAVPRHHDQGKSEKKEFIVSSAAERESMTTVLTNMAANR